MSKCISVELIFIPVDDLLPQNHTWVFGITKYGYICNMFYAVDDNGVGHWTDFLDSEYDVTHWAKIPHVDTS